MKHFTRTDSQHKEVLKSRTTLAFTYRPKGPFILSASAFPHAPIWEPVSPEWKAGLMESDRFWAKAATNPVSERHLMVNENPATGFARIRRILALRDFLVNAAGDEACMPSIEEDIEKIESFGEFWMNTGARLVRGRPISCHDNSLLLWSKRPTECAVATGYALSTDGMWRQHSWCVRATRSGGRIIETTVPRVLYFGFTLTTAEAQAWFSKASLHFL